MSYAFNPLTGNLDRVGGVAAAGETPLTSVGVDANTLPGTNPVVPSATRKIEINGAAVANHSVPLETRSRVANEYNVEVQYSATAAVSDATKSGIAHFDSSQFIVNSVGFTSFTMTPTFTSITFGTAGTPTALSRYEQGTFTPIITGSVSNPTTVYSLQIGRYTIIGNRVSLNGTIGISSITGGSGNIELSGLPFTANSGTNFAFGACLLTLMTFPGYCIFGIGPSTSKLLIFTCATGVVPTNLQVSALPNTNGSGFQGSINYEV